MQYLALALLSAALTARAAPQGPPPAELQFKVTQTLMTPVGARVIPVVVGGDQRVFTPNNIQANPGDVIQFQFNTNNHTVTQSAPETPCRPLQDTANPNAINSGFLAFDAGRGMVSTFTVPVTSTAPLFMYCSQGNHCQQGMVMAINAPPEALIQYANLARAQPPSPPAVLITGGTVAELPIANAVFQPGVVPPAAPPGAQQPPVGAPQPVISILPPGASVLPDGSVPGTVTFTTTITPGVPGQPAAALPTNPPGAPAQPGVSAGRLAEPIVILNPPAAGQPAVPGAQPGVAAPPGQPVVPAPLPAGAPAQPGVSAGQRAEPIVILNPGVAVPGAAVPGAAPGAVPGAIPGAQVPGAPIPNSGAVPVFGMPLVPARAKRF